MTLIDEICHKNYICEPINLVNTKFNKGRLFATQDYFIKLYPKEKNKYFDNEIYIYKILSGKQFIPNLIDYGKEGEKYIVIKRIDATTIYEVWDYLNENERMDIIKQISDILRQINSLPTINKESSFKEYLTLEFEKIVNQLGFIDTRLKKSIDSFFYNTIDSFSDLETQKLIYSDFHFGNFLIDKKRNVYIIDFEGLISAPLDYQLNSIIRMCMDPSIDAPNNITPNINEYKNILKYFEKYYKEMFLSSNLKERLKLYILINHLHTLKHRKISSKQIEDDIER